MINPFEFLDNLELNEQIAEATRLFTPLVRVLGEFRRMLIEQGFSEQAADAIATAYAHAAFDHLVP